MAQIPYADSNGLLSVEVKLKNASNVYLLDSENFRRWKSGKGFRYYGGYYDHTPITIRVEGRGRWYLIVENSTYSYRFY